MVLAALSPSVGNQLNSLPSSPWVRIAIGVLLLIAVVLVIRKVAKMNKLILGIVLLLVLSMVGFNWIYQRNEPAWATPVVSKLAAFFPTKDAMK